MSKWEKIYAEPEVWNRLYHFRLGVAELYGVDVTKVRVMAAIDVKTEDIVESIIFNSDLPSAAFEKILKEYKESRNESSS